MIGAKVTLTAGQAGKIVDGAKGVGSRTALLKSALTDVVLGGPDVTSATGYATAAALANLAVLCGADSLWAISATGGDIYVLYPENG